MSANTTPLELAERVAENARGLGIETALIGASALAVHGYVRGTLDIDLASIVDPYVDLGRLEEALRAVGFRVKRNLPEDPLGGLVRVWTEEDEDEEPLNPVEIVNFLNPHRPLRTPAREAIDSAVQVANSRALRCVQLPHLIALKLYAAHARDHGDVVEVLVRNPQADRENIRALCKHYGLDMIDELLAKAEQEAS